MGWFGDWASRRGDWKRLEAELRAGESPLHQWVRGFPEALFCDVIVLEAPERAGDGFWRIAALQGRPIYMGRGREHREALRIRMENEELPWGPAQALLARRLSDVKIRALVDPPPHSELEIRGLVQKLNAFLPSRVALPSSLHDALGVYRSVFAYLPTSARRAEDGFDRPSIVDELGEADLRARLRAYARAVRADERDLERFLDAHLPGDAQRWRPATKFVAADYDWHFEEPHTYDHSHPPPHLFSPQIYTDGPRTIEVLFHPTDLFEIRADYPTLEDFIVRGVIPRIAGVVEERVAHGRGWHNSV